MFSVEIYQDDGFINSQSTQYETHDSMLYFRGTMCKDAFELLHKAVLAEEVDYDRFYHMDGDITESDSNNTYNYLYVIEDQYGKTFYAMCNESDIDW